MRKTLDSFKYALRGIGLLFLTQRNARIHLAILTLAILMGIRLKIEAGEWLWLFGASGLVLTAEAFNTSIEYLTDLASPQFSLKAGRVKDVAAGAVLLSAITAVSIGLMIFIPKMFY